MVNLRDGSESTKDIEEKWYNKRIHGALDLDIGETPEEAFKSEKIFGLYTQQKL